MPGKSPPRWAEINLTAYSFMTAYNPYATDWGRPVKQNYQTGLFLNRPAHALLPKAGLRYHLPALTLRFDAGFRRLRTRGGTFCCDLGSWSGKYRELYVAAGAEKHFRIWRFDAYGGLLAFGARGWYDGTWHHWIGRDYDSDNTTLWAFGLTVPAGIRLPIGCRFTVGLETVYELFRADETYRFLPREGYPQPAPVRTRFLFGHFQPLNLVLGYNLQKVCIAQRKG